ncbi:hypothetical protein BEP19_16610 [Ammoniphilus oxalaticus]|uniref:Uncharacterized protein n=1 Tax=Ammoniphilus oxalaticus TaxID=66863 RepID=A0A419SQR1_9BACL|nr:hypothetical protein [Ammoniphilus oxalaticus]RKD26816.1 hypothetical protein BEP19_16610 [Ammoniphilus oxalaticus]
MIYLQPQFRNDQGEILNVVNTKGKAVGYLSYMYREQGDLYVLGQLDDEGEKQNFLDVTTHFIDGLRQSVVSEDAVDPYVCIYVGGQTLDLEETEKEEDE